MNPKQGEAIPAQESPRIELPDDAELKSKLNTKLDEYRRRLESKKEATGRNTQFTAPELIFKELADVHYKFAVLERLLDKGVVVTNELQKELQERDGQFMSDEFNNACAVIDDYCKTGGKNNMTEKGEKKELE